MQRTWTKNWLNEQISNDSIKHKRKVQIIIIIIIRRRRRATTTTILVRQNSTGARWLCNCSTWSLLLPGKLWFFHVICSQFITFAVSSNAQSSIEWITPYNATKYNGEWNFCVLKDDLFFSLEWARLSGIQNMWSLNEFLSSLNWLPHEFLFLDSQF